MAKKYIFENGVMKLNPQYLAEKGSKATSVAAPDKALAIVSSMDDVSNASDDSLTSTGEPRQISGSTQSAIEIMQEESFYEELALPPGKEIDSSEALDQLTQHFAKYEIPLGLINKLMAMVQYNINMIIDDSGSMTLDTDVKRCDASDLMKTRSHKVRLSRWEEVEDRLHTMIDILAFIPTPPIKISFLNQKRAITLDRQGKTPQEFAADAHAQISSAFQYKPTNRTPTYAALDKAFRETTTPTLHYFFTDGMPSDATVEEVAQLIKNRPNPQQTPLTLMSCTNEDGAAIWMKKIEEEACFVSELDDFEDEKAEVLNDQGPGMPFSKGMWLISQLVSVINPDDLDAIDDSVPFSRSTMSNLLGYELSTAEYRSYFNYHPQSAQYADLYHDLETKQESGKNIAKNWVAPPAYNASYHDPSVRHTMFGGSATQTTGTQERPANVFNIR